MEGKSDIAMSYCDVTWRIDSVTMTYCYTNDYVGSQRIPTHLKYLYLYTSLKI